MSNDMMKSVASIVDTTAQKFVDTLTQYKWDILPDAQLQAAKQALTKSDYIAKIACQDVGAVHDSLMKAAILGLDLTEGKRQGWLLPRKNSLGKTVIQLQVGYKGVEAIHQRMGVIDRLSVRVVYDKDEFDWSGDDQEKPSHKADWMAPAEKRGPVKGAYVITYYPDKTIQVIVKSIEELYEKHRNYSDSWKTYVRKTEEFNSGKEKKKPFPPPWATHETAMIEKTMAFIASKQWPANNRNLETSSKILETLHEVDSSDYTFGYTPEQRDVFHQILEAQDSLGYELFERRVGIEVMSRLVLDYRGAIPRGDKGKTMDAIQVWASLGAGILYNVESALEDDDIGLLHENLEGILDVTKGMLMRHLGRDLGAKLVSMMGGEAA